jgi:hypothetical protein
VPLAEAAERVPAWQGVLEPVDDHTCALLTSPDTVQYLAYRIVLLPVDYTLLDPPELAVHLATIARRAGQSALGPQQLRPE